jgi:hypothetical protein
MVEEIGGLVCTAVINKPPIEATWQGPKGARDGLACIVNGPEPGRTACADSATHRVVKARADSPRWVGLPTDVVSQEKFSRVKSVEGAW